MFDHDTFPLTAAQYGLWLADQLSPGNPGLIRSTYLEICGDVDPGILADAVRNTVCEVDALHARFVETGGEVRQRLVRPDGWVPDVVDLSTDPAPERSARAWMAADQQRSPDLTEEPAFAFAIMALGGDRWWLYHRFHRAVIDGRTHQLLLSRIDEWYAALTGGSDPGPGPESSRFLVESDVAYRSSEDFTRDRRYWQDVLAGLPEITTLAGRSAPTSEAESRRAVRVLPADRITDLRAAARRMRSTWSGLMIAHTAAFTARVTGEQDSVVGLVTPARRGGRMRATPGLAANIVPVRLAAGPGDGVRELVERTTARVREGTAHDRFRTEDIRAALGTAAGKRLYGPVLNVMPQDRDLTFAGFPATVYFPPSGAEDDLSVIARSRGDELAIEFNGHPELYQQTEIEALADRFTTHLDGVVDAADDTPTGRIQTASGDQQALTAAWGRGPFRADAVWSSVVDTVAVRVAAGPDLTAVWSASGRLSYQELWRRAGALSGVLRARGVGRGSLVAVCMEPGPGMVVALLAVWWAGAAYLPLDPAYPAARLRFMVDDACPVLAIVSGDAQVVLPEGLPCLDPDVVEASTPAAAVAVGPSDAAYVVYTSGSTGRPKGTVIEHGALGDYLGWCVRDYPALAGVTLVHSSISFDLTVTGLWGTLAAGGTVVLADLLDETSLPDGAPRITFLKATPSHLELLRRLPDRFSPSETLVLGGELLVGEVLDGWRATHPGVTVFNVYGHTETTVNCAENPIPAGELVAGGALPVGGPFDNTRMYVLDDRLLPVPPGVTGEVYVGGAGLARGYLDRRAMTAGRFVADPFGPPGVRMYRSGDLARWNRHGELEFRGRADEQIKVRGHRVEPGEIRAALTTHPRVTEAAIRVVGHDIGDQLVGYVVRGDDMPLEQLELRRHVEQTLPAAMLPDVFVVLDALPLTANGKLDRAALPRPRDPRTGTGRLPRGPREEILCELFARVLDLPLVGIDDNFFAIGGHSLLATRLVGRIRDTLGVELPIRAVFEAPTVAALVERVDSEQSGGAVRAAMAPRPRPDRVPLSFGQRRIWFLEMFEDAPTYNIPVVGRMRGELRPEVLEEAFNDLVARHESLRTVFPSRDGEPFQQVIPAERVHCPLPVIDVAPDEVDEHLDRIAREPFDLGSDLMLRTCLLRLGPDEHVLAMIIHHIAADGWSFWPFGRDLGEAYRARLDGRPPATTPLPVQYADYTLWQREVLGDESDPDSMISQQLGFWTRALDGLPTELDLPTDRPRPTDSARAGALLDLHIDDDLHRDLLALARDAGVSLFMVLQAAIATLLTRLGAGTDIPIGTPIAGRTDHALDDVVGFFLNTLVLRTDTSGNPTFRDLLIRTRETDLAAYAHQELPFEHIVETLNPPRSLSRHPLFQTALVMGNPPPMGQEFPGVETDFDEISNGTAKFDLTFRVVEEHDERGLPDGLTGDIEYDTELFDTSTVRDIAKRLRIVLRAVVTDSGRPIYDLDVLDDDDRRLVLDDRDAGTRTGTWPALFERVVASDRDAVALRDDERDLSYGELDARANRLAHLLVEQGVGPERHVVVALPSSTVEFIVAFLATLKAGGAHVPVDPSQPADRVAAVLEVCAPHVVVTTTAHQVGKPGVPRIELDDPSVIRDLGRRPSHPLSDAERIAPLHPSTTAYVIHTSGSTGRPKGVVVPHSGVANLAAAQAGRLGAGPGSRVLQFFPSSFDASLFEVALGLLSGGTLVLAAPDRTEPGRPLAELVAGQRITHLTTTPSVLALMPAQPELPEDLTVIVGGEAFPADVANRWAGARRTVNAYGPTENTLCASLSEPLTARQAPPPIGTAVTGTRAMVLDDRLRPSPPGVVGELYLAGTGVARGYLGQPALSAGRFVACPSGGPGGRMYRTGDRARWTVRGELEFAGRTDGQVQVRGHRVELDEVAGVLLGHAEVDEAIVVPRGDLTDVSLVAYIAGVHPAGVDVESVRSHAARTLPTYMCPTAVVVLDRIPLTSHGKVDHAALPAVPAPSACEVAAARTPTEEVLCMLAAEALGAAAVGPDDDFFALGGHSLLAVRLINQIRAAFGNSPSLRRLFENPTMGAVAELVEGAAGDTARDTRPAPSARPRPDSVPLSPGQRRLWFLYQLDPTAITYHIPLVLPLAGEIDGPAMELALGDVLTRHEALRTVFRQDDDVPRQLVLDPADAVPALPMRDVCSGESTGRVRELVEQPFDLSDAPPLRAELLRTARDQHVFVLVVHHIAADGLSMPVLMRDLGEAYRARLDGHAPSWEPLPMQYADYALWQDELLGPGTDSLEEQHLFWVETLRGLPDELDLPADRPRSSDPSPSADGVRVRLDPVERDRLTQLARESGATPFMVLQTVLAVLLTRLGAGTDVPIGTPVAGRPYPVLDELVGFFVNTLVLRTDTTGDPTFAELLARVRAADLAAYAHQDVPFEHVVETVNPARSLSRHPLFQVMLTLQDDSLTRLELPGVSVGEPIRPGVAAKVDLSFSVTDRGHGAGMDLDLLFREDMFDRSTADAIAHRWVRMLRHALDAPASRPAAWELLDDDERHRVLVAWNDTYLPRTPRTLPQLLTGSHSARAGELLVDSVERLDGPGFRSRVNRLARYLIRSGAGPERTVAVALPRSVDMLVALHAVVEAGAAYLPLEPGLPVARLRYMIDDAAPVCLLTRGDVQAIDVDPKRTSVVRLDDPAVRQELIRLDDEPVTDEDRPTTLCVHHPAYVIYTSGSTGRPKGVQVPHDAIVNRLEWMQAHGGLIAGRDRVLQKTPIGFDVSVWELFWPIACGATLVVADPGVHQDPRALAALIRSEQITVTHFVPSMLREFLAEPDAASCRSLRDVYCSGEALTAPLGEDFDAVLGVNGTRLHNLYGPTEAAVDVTAWQWRAGAGDVRIGSPIHNVRTYVLDHRLQPVPPAAVGELYLAGTGLARGYLGRRVLTAERFVADPHGPAGERMYRTGDLARWTSVGELVYHGRGDDQLKIRGMRVEPGETEVVLRAHPGVAQAAVVARTLPSGSRALVAYVVRAGGADEPDGETLRALASTDLPAHQVPASVVFLDRLPTNANGKLDRDALPDPQIGASSDRRPRNHVEATLCGLVEEILRQPRVGIDDDFFAIGGHSLLATRLVNRVRAVIGVHLPVQAVFEAPTVAGLAPRIDLAGEAGTRPVPQAGPRPDRIPLSPGQRRMWATSLLEGPSARYNLPFVFRLGGPVDPDALHAALDDVVARHESLRTVYPDHGGMPEQCVLAPDAARVAFRNPVVSSERVTSEMDRVIGHRFDLAAEVPVRAELLTVEHREHVLVLVLHHIAADGMSMAPLLADLGSAYRARAAGGAPDLPAPRLQYADYALWQRQVLGDPDDPDSELARQVSYWQEVLAGLPDELQLPTDRPRPDRPSGRGELLEFHLAPERYRSLQALARDHGVTVFMVLHAALAQLLSEHGAGTDVPIGSPAAGRDDAAVTDVVGFFVNTLVLRTDTGGDPTFVELLARVRNADLAAYAHQDVPFEHVVDTINPQRHPGRHPLFQVLLAFQNLGPRPLELAPDVTVTQERCHTGTTRFDLSVTVAEPGGTSGGLHGLVEFAVDLFDRDTVRGLADRYAALLNEVAVNPQRVSGGAVAPAGSSAGPISAQRASAHGVAAPISPKRAAARTPREEILVGLFGELLGCDAGVHDGFFALGGDSVLAIQLARRARDAGVGFAPGDVMAHPTPSGLAGIANDVNDAAQTPPDDDTGIIPLTPIAAWYRDLGGPLDGMNQSMLLGVPAGAREEELRLALHALRAHHAMLRLQVDRAGLTAAYAPWTFTVPAADEAPEHALLHRVDVAGLSDDQTRAVIRTEARSAVDRLDAQSGAVLHAVWFDAGEATPGRLLLALHHLAVDGYSWRILLSDLRVGYEAVREGREPVLPPVGTSFRRHATLLAERASDPAAMTALSAWVEICAATGAGLAERPLDPSRDTGNTVRQHAVSLPPAQAREIVGASSSEVRVTVRDALVTALVKVLVDARGRSQDRSLLLALEGHGRENADAETDLSRTVGWFTSLYPVRVDLPADYGPRAVECVGEQLDRCAPDTASYGLLRYLNPQTSAVLAAAPRPEVVVNYLGRFAAPTDDQWAPAPERDELGPGMSDAMPVPHAVWIDITVLDGADGPTLRSTWSWASGVVDSVRISAAADRWRDELVRLAEICAGGRD